MNYLKLQLFAMLAISALAHAQVTTESLGAEVDAEIDKMYVAPTAPTLQPVVTIANNNRIGFVQAQSVQAQSVQKQPVTIIEASPLATSNAESIRKGRQDEEMRTESRIVEKLEQSRMEDEKKRASVLFGDKFDSLNKKEQLPQTAEAAPTLAPTSNVQAQPLIIQQTPSLSKGDIQQEIRAALDEDKAQSESTNLFESKYVSVTAGIPQYADASAINGQYSMGVALGTSNDYFQVEGGFLYSAYGIRRAEYLTQFNQIGLADFLMNQYQTYVSAKYQLMAGSIRPTIGGLASYSYRKYLSDSFTSYGAAGTEFGHSSAIDLGIAAGIDMSLTQRFSLGADLKYMFNISSNINGDTAPGARSPEKLNYYLLGVSAKVNF